MSLSNIGNLISVINKNGNIAEALKLFENVNDAADALNKFTKISNLEKIKILKGAFKIDDDASKAALGILDVTDAIEDVSDAASDGTSVVSKFGNSLKGAFSSIGGTIAAHPIIATIAAITAALAIRAAVVEDATEKMDKALQSQSEHKDTLSEIDSINSELETTQQRIDELNAKENLSFVEKAELSDLQTANAELEKELELKERLARKQAHQAAEDAKDAINTRSAEKAFDTGTDDWYSKFIKWNAGISDKLGFQDLPNSGLGAIALFGGATEEASNGDNLFKILYDKIDQLNEAETELKKLENSLSTDDTDREIAKKESAIEKQKEKVRGLESVVLSQYLDLEQLASTFYYEDENGIKHIYEDCVAYAKAFEIIQEKYLATGSSEANTEAIDTEKAIEGVFSKVKFDGVKEKFVELGQVGRASLEEELSSGNYESLIETISNALGIDEGKAKSMLSDYIMSIADPYALKIDEIKEQLRSAFSDDEYEINLRAGENADRVWEEWTKDMSDEDWEILYSIKQENDTSTWEIEDWENAFKNVKNGADEAKGTISDLVDETQTFVTQINSIQSALSEQSTGKSISLESFNSDELKDYQSALEYVNGSLQLNEEKVTAITKAKADEIIATNQANKAHKQSEYLQNATEIEDLRAKLKTLNEGTVEYTNTKHQLDSLMSENIAIASECRQYDLLTASIKEATSAYQNWLANQNTTESGDMFDSSMDAMQAIDDVADSESDDYGRIGTKKYKSAVEFIVPDTIDKDDAVAVQNYIDSIGKYFDYDENGERVGMDITQFCNDAVKQGLMNIETDVEGNEFFNLADGVEIEDFAEKLNLSSATIQAFFGEMEEFGGEFDWADEAIQTVGDLGVKAYESADALRSIDDYSDMEIKMDVSDIENVDDKVSALDSTIQEMNNLKVKVPVDSSEAQYANDIIQYCVAQKQKLTEPVFMDIDVSQVDGDLSEIISLVQQLQTAKNDLDIKAAVGADTTEAQGKVDNLVQQIQEKSPQIKATIGEIDTSNVDTILADVSAKSVEAWVNLGVNDTAITGYVPENKEATVTYKLDSSLVDAYNPLNLNRTVTYSIVTKGVVPSVNGTAHVNGTAFANGSLRIPTDATFRNRIGRALANGNWGVDKSETALVGELGRELVVYGNRYWTVGDTGAEFTHIPKGAIVFNHKQTDEIFRNGYVTSGGGRGKAYAQGTAYVTGGIGVKNANKTAAVSSSSPSSSSTTSSSTKSTDANTTAVETNTETIEEVSENLKDWAEIYVDRIIDSLSKFKDTIDRLEVARNQNASIDGYIKEATDAIGHLQSTANYYLQKANSLGLSSDYVNKIKNGQINIQDISDENLKEKIEKFQEWYEKAKDITDQIEDLNIEINELKVQKLDNLFDDYDNLVGFHKSLSGINDVYSELAEKMTGVGNLGNLLNNLNQNKQIKAYYEAEAKELQTMLDALVADGAIGLHSDTWLEWASNIAEVKQQIVECDMELWEMKDAIREVRLKDFTDSIENLEHANDVLSSIRDLMSEEGIFDRDTIAITDLGYAQLGIMSQELVNAKQQVANYNTAIEALDKDLENGNITQNDYNELLKEYEKSQMDAVSAVKSYKDAIIDVIKNGIEKETEAMEELISKRKEDLDMQKEYYDFQKEMSDKSSEINRIKAQISAISGSDSLEDKQRLRSLQSQLKQLQDEYNETLKERQFDLVQDAYDKTSEQIQENKEDVLYELETDLEAQNKAIASVLQSVQDNYTSVYEELNILSKEYGYEMSESLTKPWEDAQNALNNYLESVGKINSNVSVNTDKIESNYNAATSASTVGSEAKINQQKATTTTTTTSNVNSYSVKASQIGQILQRGMVHSDVGILQSALKHMGYYNGNIDNDFGDQTYAALRQFQTDAKASGQYNDAIDGILGTNTKKALGLRGYCTGTTNAKSGWALLDDTKEGLLDFGSELVIADDGSIVTPYGRLKKLDGGEVILNKLQTQKLVDMVNSNFIQPTLPKLPEMKIEQRGGDVNIHYDNIIGKIDHVDKNVLPDLQTIIERSAQYTIKTLNKYSKR